MSNIAPPPEGAGRLAQYQYSYRMTSSVQPLFGMYVVLATLLGGAAGFALFWFSPLGTSWKIFSAVLGVIVFGFMAGSFAFIRFTQQAAYKLLRGQLGAALGAMGMLNKSWVSMPTVAVTRQQDMIHRLIGPPGVILVGEGEPSRLRTLMIDERKRLERILGTVPINQVHCGDGEGMVPLEKLNKHVINLGRQIQPKQMTDVLNRLKGMDATRGQLPIPKGPLPGLKGTRQAQRGR